MEVRDWFVMLVMTGMVAAATVYLYLHPGVDSFGIWAGMVTTFGGIYHWIVYLDAKRPDAEGQRHG